jgi:hypothetical protein
MNDASHVFQGRGMCPNPRVRRRLFAMAVATVLVATLCGGVAVVRPTPHWRHPRFVAWRATVRGTWQRWTDGERSRGSIDANAVAMNARAIPAAEMAKELRAIRADAAEWLARRRTARAPFGHFELCASAYVRDELNAATCALELWVMLDMPMTDADRFEAIRHLRSYQNPNTGLVVDPTWAGRQTRSRPEQLSEGDEFFTRTAFAALRAMGANFEYPVARLVNVPAADLAARTDLGNRLLGDVISHVHQNRLLGVEGADAQWRVVVAHMIARQDEVTGLWGRGPVRYPYSPAIVRAFHQIKYTFNVADLPLPRANRIVDSCLAACDDLAFYGWTHGYACYDLDLALMLYSAAYWTRHRRGDVTAWARRRLPMILAVRKPDGGFSFEHTRSMTLHCGLRMSPGSPEGDLWGTLMYLGTIKMMVELGYGDTEVAVPWRFSHVHRVPGMPNPEPFGEASAERAAQGSGKPRRRLRLGLRAGGPVRSRPTAKLRVPLKAGRGGKRMQEDGPRQNLFSRCSARRAKYIFTKSRVTAGALKTRSMCRR